MCTSARAHTQTQSHTRSPITFIGIPAIVACLIGIHFGDFCMSSLWGPSRPGLHCFESATSFVVFFIFFRSLLKREAGRGVRARTQAHVKLCMDYCYFSFYVMLSHQTGFKWKLIAWSELHRKEATTTNKHGTTWNWYCTRVPSHTRTEKKIRFDLWIHCSELLAHMKYADTLDLLPLLLVHCLLSRVRVRGGNDFPLCGFCSTERRWLLASFPLATNCDGLCGEIRYQKRANARKKTPSEFDMIGKWRSFVIYSFSLGQILLLGVAVCLASCVSAKAESKAEGKAEPKAEKKSIEVTAASEGAEKKQEKRGVWGEGYGDFGGDWGHHGHHGHHGWEDQHHVHHHHEKTIVDVKKIPAPYPVEKHVRDVKRKCAYFSHSFRCFLRDSVFMQFFGKCHVLMGLFLQFSQVHVPVHKTVHVPVKVHVPQPYPGNITETFFNYL